MKIYICRGCYENECRLTMSNDLTPDECVLGYDICEWEDEDVRTLGTRKLEHELNRRGYVVIKKGDFR